MFKLTIILLISIGLTFEKSIQQTTLSSLHINFCEWIYDLTKNGDSESWSQFEKIFENYGYKVDNSLEARGAFEGENLIEELIIDLGGNNPSNDIVIESLGFEKSKNDGKGKPYTKILTRLDRSHDNQFDLLVKLFSKYGYEFSKSVASTMAGINWLELALGSNNPDEELILNSINIKKSGNKAKISGSQQKSHTIFHLNDPSQNGKYYRQLLANYGYEMPEDFHSYAFSGLKFNLGTSNPDEEMIFKAIGINKTKNQNSISNGNEKSFTTLVFDKNSLLNGQNYKESIYFKILKNYGYEFPESQDFTWINCLGNIEIVLGTNGPDEEIILNSLGMKKNKNQRSSAQKKPSTIIHIVSKELKVDFPQTFTKVFETVGYKSTSKPDTSRYDERLRDLELPLGVNNPHEEIIMKGLGFKKTGKN